MEIVTRKGKTIREGDEFADVKILRSSKNRKDGIGWIDTVAVIISGACLKENEVIIRDVKIIKVLERCVFAVILPEKKE